MVTSIHFPFQAKENMSILSFTLFWAILSKGFGEIHHLNGVVFEKKAVFVANPSPWLGYFSIQDDFTESCEDLNNLTKAVSNYIGNLITL